MRAPTIAILRSRIRGERRSRGRRALAALAGLLGAATLATAAPARAERPALPSDVGRHPTVAVLPTPASKHWVWVNDFVFPHMADGTAHLVDGDTGRYLGTLSTGYSYSHLVLSPDGRWIYSPETYFSRGTRGKRTDVVTIYDARTLDPAGEIRIPPNRASDMPVMGDVSLTDDARYLLIYDFNPAQGITVVDMKTRRFVREIPIPGCAFAYPSGPRSFFSVCGDGSVVLIDLARDGHVVRHHTDQILPMGADPVTEKPVRVGNVWYFVTFDGRIVPLEVTADRAVVEPSWSLTSAAERAQGWRPGGLQQLAVSVRSHRLYAIMHQGDLTTHKDPGKTVWVYDLTTHRKVQEMPLKRLASSIQVTTDAAPLLFTVFIDGPDLDVYDALSRHWLRTVKDVAAAPTVLVAP